MNVIEIIEPNNQLKLENVCRTCGGFFDGEGVLIPIFDETGVIAVTNMKFQIKDELDLLRIAVTKDDNLPQQICIHCANTLKEIHIFRGVCKIAQESLEKYFHKCVMEPSNPSVEDHNSTLNENNVDEEDSNSSRGTENPIYSNIEIELCNPLTDVEEDTEFKEIFLETDNSDKEVETEEHAANIIKKCEKCHRFGYFDRAKYDMHKTRCALRPFDDKFICLYCYQEFQTVDDIENHLREIHPIIDRPYHCPVCNEYFKSILKREEHVPTHNIKTPYKCDICDRGLSTYRDLRLHKQRVHYSCNYECEICHEKFKNSARLECHKRSHNPDKQYKCNYCEKSYKLARQLKEHENIHTGEKPYKCKLCDKAFAGDNSLRFHMKLHLGIKPFQCDVCGKAFATKSSLNHHTPFHGENRPFQCEYCGRNFKTRQILRIHHRSHTDERPFKCDLCEKTYRQKLQLTQHKYSAHGIGVPRKKQTYKSNKKYVKKRVTKIKNKILNEAEVIQCPLCPKSFQLHMSFENHIKTHNEEKNYKCSECDSTFKRATGLKFHVMRIHLKQKPFKCPHCEKAFTESRERNLHMKSHGSEKPYKCSHCDKSFKGRHLLRAHERIHIGNNKFKCLICQRSFNSHAYLKHHTLTHSKQERETVTQRIIVNNAYSTTLTTSGVNLLHDADELNI